ncbi:hypothetical protein [Arenimonas sp.]|uniref:hypothetical protein n=1 Tax=Arenimonas sp. TaxID=1872635 RepID=UPI0035AF112D
MTATPTANPVELARGRRRLAAVSAAWDVLALLLVAMHSPGQMSLDTVVALYEGVIHRAVGWGPPFMASVLEWLGGGVVGAAVFVALNTALVLGGFFLVLTRGADAGHLGRLPAWRFWLALLLALNPLFLLYVGIVWKDVLLATLAMAAVVGLWSLERRLDARRWWLVVLVGLALAALPWARQQAFLVAFPLWGVLSWLVARKQAGRPRRYAAGLAVLLVLALGHRGIGAAADATITPLPDSPTGTGVAMVMAYDLIGIGARTPGGQPLRDAGADDAVVAAVQDSYSVERIDTTWARPEVKAFFGDMGREALPGHWWRAVRAHAGEYLAHRREALGALLGFGSMEGCVAGYWGVAGIPEHVLHAGLIEEMDPRDRLIGHVTRVLRDTPVLRHWAYLLLLAAITLVLLRRRGGEGAPTALAATLGAWLYFGSYVPTTIACDFRYLYPTAALACLVALHLLVTPRGAKVSP